MIATATERQQDCDRFIHTMEGGLLALGATVDGTDTFVWETCGGHCEAVISADPESGYSAYFQFADPKQARNIVNCNNAGELCFQSHGSPQAQAAAILGELYLLYVGVVGTGGIGVRSLPLFFSYFGAITMSTIQVEILPAESWDKVRVRAFTQCGKSLRTKYTSGYTHEQIIARAAAKLAKRLGWAGEQIRLHSESGRVFAFVSDGALAAV